MPIDHRIDARRRVVFATARGVLHTEDLFAYQREVWSDPAVAGFHELVDMRAVDRIVYESQTEARDLAVLAAGSDRQDAPPTRMAIVASDDLAFGLGRMYQALREITPGSNKQVRVFRDYDEGLRWLADPGAA